jgi:GT2 family glycosyltransferase
MTRAVDDRGRGLTCSVVIPSYQRPDRLAGCLRALRDQVEAADEVIVVCKAWDRETIGASARSGDAQVVTTSAIDIASAITCGIEAATSSIVAFIDDDAEAGPTWIRSLKRHFADGTVGAVGGRDHLYIDGVPIDAASPPSVGRITWYGAVIGNHHAGRGGARAVEVLKGCNMSVRRDLVSGVSPALLGPYSYRWEDDLCGQVRRSGARVIYDPAIAVTHLSSRGSADRAGPGVLFASAHNLACVQFRYLPPTRRLLWLCFSLLVGQPDDPGILRIPQLRGQWWSGFRGKLSGVRAASRSGSGVEGHPERSR